LPIIYYVSVESLYFFLLPRLSLLTSETLIQTQDSWPGDNRKHSFYGNFSRSYGLINSNYKLPSKLKARAEMVFFVLSFSLTFHEVKLFWQHRKTPLSSIFSLFCFRLIFFAIR